MTHKVAERFAPPLKQDLVIVSKKDVDSKQKESSIALDEQPEVSSEPPAPPASSGIPFLAELSNMVHPLQMANFAANLGSGFIQPEEISAFVQDVDAGTKKHVYKKLQKGKFGC